MTLVTALAVQISTAIAADQCPRRFDEMTTGLPSACLFLGRYNPTCGDEAVALFAGDGTALVVSLSSSATAAPLFIPAQVLSATEGKVVLWHPDLELEHAPSSGTVRLEGDGQYLRLRIAGSELTAGGCRFEEFVGRFAGMATADTPTSALHPVPIATREQASLVAAQQ